MKPVSQKTTSSPSRSIELFGVPMHSWTMNQTVDAIFERIEKGQFTQHVVINVAKLVNMHKDPSLRNSILGCDIINIDGMGVVWGARFLGQNVPERVAGIDLFFQLLEKAAEKKKSVFFLGATEEVLKLATDKILLQFPQLRLAGTHHGYFWNQKQGEAQVVQKIASSEADLLFVAMSSPQKENFIEKHQSELNVRFAMGIGGTLDVVAGKTKRAPLWMQNAGLEWFYRFAQEPKRMWKRYLSTNTQFAWMLAREKLNQRLQGGKRADLK